jgi:hypothetical protein
MTGTTTTRAAGTRDKNRPAVPAPRRSPEESREEIREPVAPQESYGYPLIRYAMEHATALRANGR